MRWCLTCHFFGHLDKLIPCRLFSVAKGQLVPLGFFKKSGDKFGHIIGVGERDGLIASSRDGRFLVCHVNGKGQGRQMSLERGQAVAIKEVSDREASPFEVCLSQCLEGGFLEHGCGRPDCG